MDNKELIKLIVKLVLTVASVVLREYLDKRAKEKRGESGSRH